VISHDCRPRLQSRSEGRTEGASSPDDSQVALPFSRRWIKQRKESRGCQVSGRKKKPVPDLVAKGSGEIALLSGRYAVAVERFGRSTRDAGTPFASRAPPASRTWARSWRHQGARLQGRADMARRWAPKIQAKLGAGTQPVHGTAAFQTRCSTDLSCGRISSKSSAAGCATRKEWRREFFKACLPVPTTEKNHPVVSG